MCLHHRNRPEKRFKINMKLVSLDAKIRPDPQDGLSQAEGVSHFPARSRVGVRLVQYRYHNITFLDSVNVLFEDVAPGSRSAPLG